MRYLTLPYSSDQAWLGTGHFVPFLLTSDPPRQQSQHNWKSVCSRQAMQILWVASRMGADEDGESSIGRLSKNEIYERVTSHFSQPPRPCLNRAEWPAVRPSPKLPAPGPAASSSFLSVSIFSVPIFQRATCVYCLDRQMPISPASHPWLTGTN